MAKTIKDRLKTDDKVILTRCFKHKGEVFETGEYKVGDLPDPIFELGLAIVKPQIPQSDNQEGTGKTTGSSKSSKAKG